MTRRALVLSSVLSLLVLGFTLSCLAVDPPQVLQIRDPSFTASEQAVILNGVSALEVALNESYPVPSFRLTSRGWSDRDFAIYAAGRLEAAGFEVLVVEGTDANGAGRFWLLVGIQLEGRVAWIPVVAAPSEMSSSGRIGSIAWEAASSGEFASAYLAPASVVELATNQLPRASFLVIGESVQQERTNIHSSSQDPDGTIIAYVWYIDGTQVEAGASSVFHYVFGGAWTYTVTLTVYDNRGGSASASKEVEVEAEGGCGCYG